MIGMTNLDYAIRRLNNFVEEGKESNQSLMSDIEKYGIADRFVWLPKYIQSDCLGKMAQKILNKLEEGITEFSILEELKERLTRETDYVIPTNSDTMIKIYELQSMIKVIEILEFLVKKETED